MKVKMKEMIDQKVKGNSGLMEDTLNHNSIWYRHVDS